VISAGLLTSFGPLGFGQYLLFPAEQGLFLCILATHSALLLGSDKTFPLKHKTLALAPGVMLRRSPLQKRVPTGKLRSSLLKTRPIGSHSLRLMSGGCATTSWEILTQQPKKIVVKTIAVVGETNFTI
jgi:hypothetical protein